MRSFRINKIDPRRATYLSLTGQVESQLRDAYDKKFHANRETQATLARKLDVDRSAIHRRLTGRTNMTIRVIADMVWALGYAIKVVIYDPKEAPGNHFAGVTTEGSPVVPVLRFEDRPGQTAGSSPVPVGL